jgi:hypothetical protein
MPLISHEIPKALFDRHDEVSDYPYVLGHLLSLDTEYADFYKEKLKTAEYSILDNSAFELGKSIPMEELYELGKEYKPTHLVLPDVVNNYDQTLLNAKEYLESYRVEGQKYIGVCQGDTFEQIAECIDYYLREKVDIIALPFDLVKDSDFVTVRFRFLNWWYANRFNMGIGKPKFHLLGCQNPVEFALFKYHQLHLLNLIYSLDTSSPVINGWVGNELGPHALIQPKPKAKLADNLDIELSEEQINLIFKNIKTFRSYVSK